MRQTYRPLGMLAMAASLGAGTAGVQRLVRDEGIARRGGWAGSHRGSAAVGQFINAVTLRHNMATRMSTKVVPILSVGEKGYVGGAQVAGRLTGAPREAVYRYEQHFNNNNYRARVGAQCRHQPVQLQRVPVSHRHHRRGLMRSEKHTVGTGIQTGDIIRGGAVLVAVTASPAINQALNALTLNKGQATKVVPMGSIGEKAYLGGAQVSASATEIDRVKAVWQYEDLFSNGKFRVRVVLPASALNPLEMKRVDSAGVTAVSTWRCRAKARPREERRWGRRPPPLGSRRPRPPRRQRQPLRLVPRPAQALAPQRPRSCLGARQALSLGSPSPNRAGEGELALGATPLASSAQRYDGWHVWKRREPATTR